MQELAFAYFAGKISKADEKKLFEFIQKEEQNYQQFKDWERAWMLSEKEDLRTAREWESLQCRIRTHEAVNPMISKSGSDLWRWAVAIAAMFVLIAGGTWVVLNTTTFMNKAQYIVFEAPYGEKSKMTFPDGTVVWLNAGSSLKYSNKYNTDDRVVELEGEGYFEVAKKKKISFVVHTRGYDVVVKGTKFNVTAYPEDSNITTTLMEGAVELLKEKQHIAMKPGESVTLNVVSGKFTLTKVNPDVSKEDIFNYGIFHYEIPPDKLSDNNFEYLESKIPAYVGMYEDYIDFDVARQSIKSKTSGESAKNLSEIVGIAIGLKSAIQIFGLNKKEIENIPISTKQEN
jgi:ferric-dicitrate binding protein FerR (iron transport regulator)